MLTALPQGGDIPSPYERTTLVIEGLLPAIRPLVFQARDNRSHSSFEDTVAKARAQGAAYRSQTAGAGGSVGFAKAPPSAYLQWRKVSPGLRPRVLLGFSTPALMQKPSLPTKNPTVLLWRHPPFPRRIRPSTTTTRCSTEIGGRPTTSQPEFRDGVGFHPV